MRRFLIERGLGDKISPIRMVIHALAFLLYVVVFFVVSIIDRLIDPTGESLFYVHWFICAIFGLFSFLCLAIVLWNLGTYTSDSSKATNFPDETTTGISTKLQEDSILQYIDYKN